MKIFIDIGHPAHVHYFRNFIKIMESEGHEFLVTARDRQYVFELLDAYGIKYVNRGKGSKSAPGKAFYLFKASAKIFSLTRKFRPDLFIDFGTMYAGFSSFVLGKRHIVFEDTEITGLYRTVYKPFATEIYTPECFELDLGKKHKRFKGYMELAYLHEKYFTPDRSVLKDAGLNQGEKFSIVRFVDWNAAHDIGSEGLDSEDKLALVHALEKHGKVFVLSEAPLPEGLRKYELKLNPERLHSLMHFASLVAGESATMASESVILGTPAIYIDSAGRGYTRDLAKRFGTLFCFTPDKDNVQHMISKAEEILSSNEFKEKAAQVRKDIISECNDLTALMVEISHK